jgi:HEAT repeat protein
VALLELASTRPNQVPTGRLSELAKSAEEGVAVRALEALAAVGPGVSIAPIEAALGEARAAVRAAAVEALCRVAREDAVEEGGAAA